MTKKAPQTTPPQDAPAAQAAEQAPPPLKIAIVGAAPSSRMLAPYKDESWKIWTFSPSHTSDWSGELPRVSVFFELHGDMMQPWNADWGPRYVLWLREKVAAKAFPI